MAFLSGVHRLLPVGAVNSVQTLAAGSGDHRLVLQMLTMNSATILMTSHKTLKAGSGDHRFVLQMHMWHPSLADIVEEVGSTKWDAGT
jgi:hypothetical protein